MRLMISCQAPDIYYCVDFRQLSMKCQEPTNSYDINMVMSVKV